MIRVFPVSLLAASLAACTEEPTCPKFSVSSLIQHGATTQVVFALQMPPQEMRVAGPPAYSWSISAGEIAAGQHSPSILVLAPSGDVTASVEVKGFPPECQRFASASAVIP